jgi:ankyrin repeat protein
MCLMSRIECSVDGNVHDMYETILFHSASYQGTSEMVGTLLERGVKLNSKNHWARPSYMWCHGADRTHKVDFVSQSYFWNAAWM